MECKKMNVTPSINYTVQLDYTNKNWLSEIIEKHDGKIKSTSYLESISMSFTIPLSMNELFLSDLKNNKRYVDLIISESEKVD